jgi:NhaP-type Na+/H+ or K+/H+ antiporter
MTLLALFLVVVFVYGLISEKLETTPITAPILFTTIGMATIFILPDLRDGEANIEIFLTVAEMGLVLLLFTDAARTDLGILKDIRNLPVRMLGIGLPLTIIIGALVAMVIFTDLSIWEAGILAAILSPTDAGLGEVIVKSPRVPVRIRQSLNVEAGLNDGLAVPFLLFFMSLAATVGEGHESKLSRFIIEQLGYGVAVGLAIGLLGGGLLGWARRNGWMSHSFQHLGVVALPLLCVTQSNAVGASMFIAAFVAGLAVQVGYKEAGKDSVEFTEQWGHILNIAVFFLFGMLVARDWGGLTGAGVLYAVLSLTVIRMIPVAVSLIGTGLDKTTILFMGWFGPRGLASIVLGLVYIEHQTDHAISPAIRVAVMTTVFLSIFAHGLSAGPGISFLASRTPETDIDD